MKNSKSILWFSLIVVAGGILLHTSYKVQALEERLATLNKSIIAEQESIRVLKAEWSYLNDPARIDYLAKTYLSLESTKAKQLASFNTLPVKLPTLAQSKPAQANQHASNTTSSKRPSSAENPLILANY